MTLEEYREEIDRLIGERRMETILNGSASHAAIIVERMFAHASNTVRILSRSFDPAIYGDPDLVDQAERFLADPRHTAYLVVENIDDNSIKTHPFFKRVGNNDNLKVFRLPEIYHDVVGVNFSVMDEDGVRFEEDKRNVAAVASFGDSEFATDLIGFFDDAIVASDGFSAVSR